MTSSLHDAIRNNVARLIGNRSDTFLEASIDAAEKGYLELRIELDAMTKERDFFAGKLVIEKEDET